MHHRHCQLAALLSTGLTCAVLAAPVAAGIPNTIGYQELLARLGKEEIPTGAGVRVAQVEIDTGGGYGPNQSANHEYGTKNFIPMSGPPGLSTHANGVAQNYYGNESSAAPGIVDVHLYEVNHWLGSGYLRFNAGSEIPPLDPPTGLRIINNSWAGSTALHSILRRADYATETFDLLMVNGVNNASGPSNNVPLLSHMYNGLCVGKAGGGHQSGDTLVDGPGRMKPEIVAPSGLTSYSTAMVSAAAALMYETAETMTVAGGSSDSTRSETVKAVLLAGAEHRAAWTNNPETTGPNRGVTSRPLDEEMGADRVNLDNSHMIMTGGESPGMSSPPMFATAGHAGWALESVPLESSMYWRFTVPDTANPVSIAVTWHRRVPIGFTTGDVANFDLELWRVDESNQLASLVGDPGLPYFAIGNVVSNSDVDNIEHLFLKNLQPGAYVLELRRVDDLTEHETWDAAVAWLFPKPPCLADFVTSKTFEPPPDGIVDGADLAFLLVQWGRNPGSAADIVTSTTFEPPPDGVVDGADLAALLVTWGACD